MLSTPTGRRLDRPENAVLKPYFAKLAAAKAAIDEKSATIGACPWILSKIYSASCIINILTVTTLRQLRSAPLVRHP